MLTLDWSKDRAREGVAITMSGRSDMSRLGG